MRAVARMRRACCPRPEAIHLTGASPFLQAAGSSIFLLNLISPINEGNVC